MKYVVILGFVAATGLGGCSSIPNAGPTTAQVLDQATKDRMARFSLIEINDQVIAAQSMRQTDVLRSRFAQYGKPQAATIGVGDTIAVSIWQASGPGLIGVAPTGGVSGGLAADSGRGTQMPTLPEQVVAADGAISVPFAGRVRASGRTPFQVQRDIERLLTDRVIEPQVIVTVARNLSDTVIVSGEVLNAMRVPLSVRGERLLDVIAAAGGARFPPYETLVRLSRDGTTVTIPMETLDLYPDENIYVWPGDVVTLLRAPETFSVFGATLDNKQIPFDGTQLNLAQAIARSGGLLDARADPAGVFLFRFEQPKVAETIGQRITARTLSDKLPVLYHLDLRRVESYFLADQFPVQDKDIIYVANASLNDVQKFFTLVGTISGPVISGAVLTRH